MKTKTQIERKPPLTGPRSVLTIPARPGSAPPSQPLARRRRLKQPKEKKKTE